MSCLHTLPPSPLIVPFKTLACKPMASLGPWALASSSPCLVPCNDRPLFLLHPDVSVWFAVCQAAGPSLFVLATAGTC